MKKRIISLIALLALLLQLCCTPAMAVSASGLSGAEVQLNEAETDSAAAEEEFSWNLYGTYLYLNGKGDMPVFVEEVPWADARDTITNVFIGEGLTSVSMGAFYGCSALRFVSLPHGLKRIEERAFAATAITKLAVPATVTEFDDSAVDFCKQLTDVYFYGDNPLPGAGGLGVEGATIHYASTASGWENYSGARRFFGYAGRRYEPQAMTSRYEDAVSTAYALGGSLLTLTSPGEEAYIRSLVPGQSLWLGAYYEPMGMMWSWSNGDPWNDYCISKAPFYVSDPWAACLYMDGEGIWDVSDGSEYRMVFVEFEDYKAPEPLTWTFDEASGELTIYGEGDMPEYELNFDYDHPITGAPWAEHVSEIRSLVIMPGITSISKGAFANCWYLETITLPDGLTTIGTGAFEGANVKYVNQIVMMGGMMTIPGYPYSLTTIGANAFYGYSGMTEVDLLNTSVTEIGEFAFGWQRDVTTICLPRTLTTLGEYAFSGCSVAGVVLPASLTDMSGTAFANNANLTDLYFCGSRPFDSLTTDSKTGTTIHCKELNDSWRSFTVDGVHVASAVEFPSYQGHQALYVEGDYTFAQASQLARMMGGFLAASANEEEDACLISLMPENTGLAWLGAAYAGDGWIWINGEEFSYANWSQYAVHQNQYSALLCVDGMWYSQPDTNKNPALVEFPTPVSTTIVTVEIDGITVTFDKSVGIVLRCEGESAHFSLPASIEGVPVSNISGGAFVNCTLTGTLDLSATSAASFSGTFAGQTGLKTVVLPVSTAFVMDNSFENCPALESVIFNGRAPVLSTESMTGHSVTAADHAPNVVFYYVDGAEGWTPSHWNGVPALPIVEGGYIREKYAGVTLLVDHDGTVVSYIGRNPDFTIPETAGGVTVTGLGDRLFYEDTTLAMLHVPSTVTSIGEYVFFGTEKLIWIIFAGDAPTHVADTAFANASPDLHINCPGDGAGWTNPWHGIPTTLPLEDIVYYDVPGGQLAFDRVSGTITGYTGSPTAIVVPEKIDGVAVKAIADGAMKGAADLASMDLSATAITATGADIWDNCGDLVRLVLPATLTSVDLSALTNCTSVRHFIFLGDEPTVENIGSDWQLTDGCTLWFPEGADLGMLNGFSFVKYFSTIPVEGGDLMLDESTGLIVGYLGQPVRLEPPAAEGGLSIVGVGPFAFESCLSLEYVDFPAGMTQLGASAFHNCEYLLTADLSESSLTVLNEKVFHNCLRVETIALPEGITSIGSFCFNDCNALKSLNIPSTVTTIHDGAFYKCDALEELVFPAGLTYLAAYAIPYCANLKTVDLSRTAITQLNAQTFTECPALEEVYLPDTLTTVARTAFLNCTGVKSLYFMGDAPTSTGDMSAYLPNATVYCQPDAYGWGSSWYGLPVEQDPAWVLYDVYGGQLIFNTRTGEIVGYVGMVEGVTVPAEIEGVPVTGIADCAFMSCYTLITMDLSATAITSVGADVWNGCRELVRLVLPETVENFDLTSLAGCSSLMDVVFLGELPAVSGDFSSGNYVIRHRADVEPEWELIGRMAEFIPLSIPGGTLIYDEENTCIVGYYGEPAVVSGLDVTVTEIAANAFSCCQSLEIVILPETVTSIGKRAFEKCGNLRYADLSAASETVLRDEMFRDCVKLETALLPHSLLTINFYAFNDCNVLKELTFPDTLQMVGPGAFYKCYALTELTFPAALTVVYANAFTNCTGLEKLTFAANAPQVLPYYSNTEELATFIPDAVVYYMEYTEGWSDPFSGLKAVSYPNPNMADYAVPGGWLIFSKTSGLIMGYKGEPTSIRLPEAIEGVPVTGFAAGALEGCTELEWADLGATSMYSLPAGLFGGCTALTDVIMPRGIDLLLGDAFRGCTALERLVFTDTAPTLTDGFAQELPTVAPHVAVYYPEHCADGWHTPFWHANPAYPYASREGCISWPYPGGTLFFNGDSGAIAGSSVYGNQVLIPETVLGQAVESIAADAFGGQDFVRMFFLGKAPAQMDLSSCPRDMAVYYPVADADLWEDAVQGFAARPCSPVEDMVSHAVTGGAILLDPANGLISGYTGSPTQVLVPASISGHPVTGIRGDAFAGAKKLELVILPDSVTYVERDAFADFDGDIYGPEALGFTPLKVTATEPVHSATVGGSGFTLKVTTNIPYALPLAVTNGTVRNSVKGVYTFHVDLSSMEAGEYIHTFTVSSADYGLSHELTLFVDRKAPSAPGNFRAEAGVLSNTLYWEASPEANVAGYRIWLGSETLVLLESKDTLTFTHSGLTAGKEYTYAVTAVDIYGQESVLSPTVSATPMPDTVAPVITGVSPGNGSTLTGTVTFTVEAEDNIGLAAITVEASSDEGEEKSWTQVSTASFAGVRTGKNVFSVDTTAYDDARPLYIRITAADIYDNVGHGSTLYTYALDNTPPEQVTGLRAEATTTVITLNWDDVAARDFMEFRVEQLVDGLWTQVGATSAARGIQVSGLTPATMYTFRVRAVDQCGNEGQWSEELSVSTLADVYPPVITAINPAPGYYSGSIPMRFSADDDFGISSWLVQVSYDGLQWNDVGRVDSTATSIYYPLDTAELEEGSIYVRAIVTDRYGNVSNTGADAPCNQYMIDRTAPDAPAGVDITAGDGYLAITWEKGSEEDLNTYNVWRSLTGEEGSFTLLQGGLQQLYWRDSAVEYGRTYYYYVTVRDHAGNVSEHSAVVSGVPMDDSQPPQVVSVSPSDGFVLGRDSVIRVRLYDNNKVTTLCWQVGEGTVRSTAVSVSDGIVDLPLDLSAMGSGDFVLTLWCVDAAGHESAPVGRSYSLDLTPPAQAEAAAEAAPLSVEVSWKAVDDADLAGYQVYRSVNGGSWVYLLQRSAGQSSYSYTDTDVQPGESYSYRIRTLDTHGNTADGPATAAVSPIDRDVIPPSAILDGSTSGVVGMEMAFSARRSSDNRGIASYLWNFGDGFSSTLMEPTHIYEAVGTYDVSLAVTDTSGNTTTAAYKVKVEEPTRVGQLTVTVVDENGSPVPNAGVWLDLGDANQSVVYTNALGQVTVTLPAGSHDIGAYIDGYLPARETVNITAGVNSSLRLVTVHQDLVVGELTVERMTLEEIIAAGIDISDPANQQVFHFTIHLTYGDYDAFIETMYNGEGEVLVDPEPIRILDSDDEEREVTVTIVPTDVGGGPSGGDVGGGWGGEPNAPLVVIMDIPGTASWLKDFFEVRLTVLNQADSEFALDNCQADLIVPNGLTLMETAITSASPHRSMGTIYGQSSASATWIIRGDKGGDYNLSADFSGILRDFNRKITAEFKTAEPFHVREGDGLTLEIKVENAIMADADGAIRVGLRNDDPDPYYLPNIALDPSLVTLIDNFKTAGYVTLDTGLDVLNTGETIWWDYIVPRDNWDLLMPKEGESEKDFYLLNAIVEATGGVELPWTIEEVLPFTIGPDLIEVSRLSASGAESAISYVNLSKANAAGGEVPALRIRTYRLDPTTGEYVPTSMQINIKDEHLMKKGDMDEVNGLTVTTNEEGIYDLSGYKLTSLNNDKTYNIRVSARRAQAVEIPVVLRGKTADVGRVDVYVYTTDEKGEILPLEGATVTLTGHGISDTADENGLAEFKYVDQGYQEIVVTMDGYLPVTDLVTVAEDSEFSYRLVADDDPTASRVLSVTTNLTQWTSGNQVIFPEGRVTGRIQFRLERRVAEGETFRRYRYRIVRDGAVAEEGEFTSDTGFSMDASHLKKGDKLQFAVETFTTGNILCVSPYTDCGIVVTGVPDFFSDALFDLSALSGIGLKMDSSKMFEYKSESIISEVFTLDQMAKGIQTKDDEDGKQQTLIDEINKGTMRTEKESKLFPIQAKYEMSGKFTLSIVVGESKSTEEKDSIRTMKSTASPTQFESSFSYTDGPNSKAKKATGQFRLDFVFQYDPARDDWDLTVQGTVAAEQEFTLAKAPTKLLLLSLGLKTQESATLNLFKTGVGPDSHSEVLGNGDLFDKAALSGELKGAVGVKAGSEKVASGDVYLKLGLEFEFLPDLILGASAAMGIEGNVLIWGGEKDLLSEKWVFSPDAKPTNLSAMLSEGNSTLMAVRGNAVAALGSGGTVISDIFGNADPRLASLPDGRVLMVWCGYTGDAGAPVGLYWAIWDGAAWSAPALVERDGTADLYPAMITVDGVPHLVWVDFTESVPANMNDLTMDEIRDYAFSRLGVSYAAFDGSGWTSSTIYEGGSIAAMPRVAVAPDGRVLVAWIGNEGNQQTADTESPDCVRWVLTEDGGVIDQGVVAAPSVGIADLALGFANGFRMALLADTADGRVRVHHSRYTAAGWLEPAEAGSLTGEDGAMVMSPDGKIWFINSGRLFCYESGHLIHLLDHELLAEDSDRLTWTETEEGGVLLWTTMVDNRHTLCALAVTDGGEAGSPVVIKAVDEGTLTCLAAAQTGDELMILSACSYQEGGAWMRDLNKTTRTLGVDLSLTDGAVYHSGYLFPGVSMDTMVMAESLGLTTPGSFTASIVTADGQVIASAEGGSGLTATIRWTVPASYAGEALYVTVSAAGDENAANDSVVMANVIRDLALSDLTHVGRMNGADIFTVRVTNEGLVTSTGASITVSLLAGEENLRGGMPVVSVPELAPGAAVDLRVELTLDRTADCPLVFRLDGEDGDADNDAAYLTLHPEAAARKETVVAFRGWTQENGRASASWEVDNRLGDSGTFHVMVASYDEFGQMVDCAYVTLEAAEGSLQTLSASVAEGHTVRAYLMDSSWTPLDTCRTLGE